MSIGRSSPTESIRPITSSPQFSKSKEPASTMERLAIPVLETTGVSRFSIPTLIRQTNDSRNSAFCSSMIDATTQPGGGGSIISSTHTSSTTIEREREPTDHVPVSIQFYVHSGMIILTFVICIMGIIISPTGPNVQWFQSIAMLCLGLILPNPKNDDKNKHIS